MRLSQSVLLVSLATLAMAAKDTEPSPSVPAPACTATSTTGSYFDLRPDIAWPEDSGKAHSKAQHKDYYARGWDYGKNFTLNICNSVVAPVTDVVGVSKSQWANVSAYYTSQGNIYSIGSQSLDVQSRGRKLVLQYSDGSPCGKSKSKSKSKSSPRSADSVYDEDTLAKQHAHEVETYAKADDPKDRKKSTTISFLCDRDVANTHLAVSFVGTDPDECAYFFEARSHHACASSEPHKPGSVGPGSIFGIILVIAVLVYFLGGVFYNRTVSHARGWRQLPNYSLWSGMWSFISDMFVIATASCARFLPGRRGYSYLSANDHPRNRNSDAENRLIDQLDEEWDD
ncbi:unnamed protein product [Clonostachys rhizophaga]|uniref:MRH domain-containing protein n=1 Tax=Clonostachys rhizophaga TaxID=160324 RepID=A0A9N9YGU1_9HYPO|nr:unnamed protein product [Clonostachys rhizophaga]